MRKTLYKLHKKAALFAMLPLIIISLTGSILVFKQEINSFLMPETFMVSNVGQRLSYDQLAANIKQQLPDYHLGTWEIFGNIESEFKIQADRVFLVKQGTFDWYKVYLDPFSGQLLTQPKHFENHYLMDWLVTLHYTLLLNETPWLPKDIGTWLGFIFSLLLLFLGISGLVMYKKFWRKMFTVRWGAVTKVLFSDLHKSFGALAAPIIIVLSITGGYFNLIVILHELEEDEAHHDFVIEKPLFNQQLSLDRQAKTSLEQLEGLNISYMTFPFEPELPFVWYGKVPDTNILTSQYASYVAFDSQTGKQLAKLDARNTSFGYLFFDSFRTLHFGNFAGTTVKVIWCILGGMPLLLAFTGFYLWYQRNAKRGKKSRVLGLSQVRIS